MNIVLVLLFGLVTGFVSGLILAPRSQSNTLLREAYRASQGKGNKPIILDPDELGYTKKDIEHSLGIE